MEGSSTCAAHYRADADGRHYRLKLNAGRPGVSFHEVFASQLLNAIGFSCAPRAALVSHSAGTMGAGPGDIWIASQALEGFEDAGVFLTRSGVEHVDPSLKDRYRAHAARCRDATREAASLLETPAVRSLVEGWPKGGVDRLTARQHATLQPLRDCYRRALQAQDRMFELLPPAFGRELLRAFYVCEIVANWDFMNHARANTGFTVKNGIVRAHTVDFGNSGPIGFGGQSKAASLAAARLPARIDDPYLREPGPDASAGAARPLLWQEDMRFEAVSRTFGVVGQLPRSAAFARFLAPVIRAERESGAAPDEALEVAWHLSRLPRDCIHRFARAMFAQGRAHPDAAIARLFFPGVTPFDDADALARAYQRRVDGIVERAMHGGQLQRWAARHPEQAARIAHGLATPGEPAFTQARSLGS